ncbi:MAG: ATP-binding protein [Candidatus Krumholzibacteria bacterium]|nr:ATP-binding protein [Candidatus Krumholzibacteria bacterium]
MREDKHSNKLNNCWEYLTCDKTDCPAYGQENAPCWEITGHRCKDRVFPRLEEKLIQCCFKCSFFKQLKERVKGRRWVDITLLETLEDALVRSSMYSKKVEDLYMEVIRRSKLMNLLGEVSKIISHLDKEEDIILAILTVITAKQGLGFNRSFVFLRGQEFDMLRGKYALGPSSAEEADSIWRILEKDDSLSLDKLVSKGQKLHYLRNSPLTKITSQLAIPINDLEGVMIRGMHEVRFVKKDDLASNADKSVSAALGLEDFCICPIATIEDSLGLLIVDNIFTGKAITVEDAHLLEMIVSHATTSLRAAQLKESLKKNVESLKATYRKLKAYEERIMKAERLAISGELTSSVIHEIKNPLVAIGGFARNLFQSKNISGSDRDKLEIIMNEALRLERYLESLQSKVSEIKLEDGDINQVIEDNCQLLQKDCEDRGITILKSLAPDLPRCQFDVVKLHEVFLNIIQNAIEAIRDGGVIRLSSWQDSGKVCVQISDNGHGIPNDQIYKIFTPFFTTKEEGSGLGLAFAQRIVKDHGGNISVTSAEGKGASFLVTLPLVREPSAIQTS